MNGRYAIVTAAFGEAHERLSKVSVPMLESYAARIGADFIKLKERAFSWCHSPVWEKFQLVRILQDFDRVAWIDVDVIVNPSAPSIFEAAPSGKFSAFDEGLVFEDRQEQLWNDAAFYGISGSRIEVWPHKYFNSGVMVVNRSHRPVLKTPTMVRRESIMPEQTYLNLRLAASRIPCHDLTSKWNGLHSIHSEGARKDLWIVHYAGWPKTADWVDRVIVQMKKDLSSWGVQ